MWQHHALNVDRNNFYGVGAVGSYVIPVFNDSPSLVKQFNSLSYEGDSGWELEYIETDIGDAGVLPTLATTWNTTLQLSGAAPNSTFTGPNTVTAKTNTGISWAVFVSPLSSQYQFTNVNDVVLTPASGSTLAVTNPSSITDNNLVFLVQHTVGTSNSIQTLDITGTGASLAFTVALLTVNTVDSIAFSALTPASQIFNSAGANNVVFSTAAFTNYYIDNADITINTSGMPASTSVGSPTNARNGDNLTYTIPVTVPSTATSGVITVGGTATLKPTLTWATVASPGVLATPSGTAATVPYYISPYDAATQRFATITYTASATTKVLLLDAYSATYNVSGATITKTQSNEDGVLVINVQLPIIASNTTATATIAGAGEVTATLGAIPATQALNAAGDVVNITSTWNVDTKITPNQPWLKLNGTNGVAIAGPGVDFTISADANSTGSSRSATAIVETTNTRVTGISAHTITVTQAG